jgi:uncharacterized membrane protein YgaE (UPF0421/DUF939 family)
MKGGYMKLQKIGMRTIKTAFAVSLTIYISHLLNLDSPIFAGIAAILAMKASVSESLSIGKNRMLGTILGGIVALSFSYIAPTNILTIGIGIIIIIYICNLLGWKKSIELASIVFLSIIMNYEEGNRLNYAIARTLSTLIGLVIGTVINYFIVPPKSSNQKHIEETINKINMDFKDAIEKLIWNKECCLLDKLKESLNKLENEYAILKRDTKLIIGKKDEATKFESAFDSFENMYYHLKIISSMGKIPPMDEENRKIAEKLFDRKIFPECNDNDNISIIYNYHLNRILSEMNSK